MHKNNNTLCLFNQYVMGMQNIVILRCIILPPPYPKSPFQKKFFEHGIFKYVLSSLPCEFGIKTRTVLLFHESGCGERADKCLKMSSIGEMRENTSGLKPLGRIEAAWRGKEKNVPTISQLRFVQTIAITTWARALTAALLCIFALTLLHMMTCVKGVDCSDETAAIYTVSQASDCSLSLLALAAVTHVTPACGRYLFFR